MDQPSTSGVKRRKIQRRNPNRLTDEELRRVLEDSDFTDIEGSESEKSYVPSEDDSSSEDDENEGNLASCCSL